MRKRWIYLLLLTVGVLVGVLAVIFSGEREPEYGGRKLSEWVQKLPSNAAPDGDSAAEKAIRQIGTNSLPYR